jgi:hypothetical protein
MPNGDVKSYVPKAELKDGKILLTVQVADFTPGEAVEISGQATQNNGALATFYDIQNAPSANNSGDWGADPAAQPDSASSVTVEAYPVDAALFEAGFEAGEPVTVVARVAKVWVTVLSKDDTDEKIKAWTESTAATVRALPR